MSQSDPAPWPPLGFERRRVALATGVTLDVTLGGTANAPPVILLHGFPESARTWRHQLAELRTEFRFIAPDQRGFAGSDKPRAVKAYRPDRLVADVFALADALSVERFALVGHDWGGAVAWAAALRHPERLTGLAVINGPHPYIFQDSLWRDPAQRAASQYILDYRQPDFVARIRQGGLERFLDEALRPHLPPGRLTSALKSAYLREWGHPGALEAMFKWYSASPVIVPAVGETGARPPWLDRPFPEVTVPVQMIWGAQDRALLPIQLENLDRFASDLRVETISGGHFLTWEHPAPVSRALRVFLSGRAEPAR
ncbi:alpha/beta fold hydrolase [Caulobacter segnis]